MTPTYTGQEAIDSRKPQAWTCPRCKRSQVGVISEGCQHCGAGSAAPYKGKKPATRPPLDDPNAPMETAAVEDPHTPITVYRLVEYRGPKEWVEATVQRSLHGGVAFRNGAATITATEVDIDEGQRLLIEHARQQPGSWAAYATGMGARADESSAAGTGDPAAVPAGTSSEPAVAPAADADDTHAAQLFRQRGEEYVLCGRRTVSTIIAALTFYASEAAPEGGDDSYSSQECIELAEALWKGHLGE